YVILPLQYFLVAIDWFSMFTIFIPVYGFLFLPILSALLGDPAHFLDRSTKIQWALMISVFCISHIPALLTLDISGYEGKNLLLMIFLILVVQSSDVLQYVWGKLFGKRKIAPTLSPSKTVEGFVGGVLSASLLGMLLHWLTPFNAWQAFLMSLLICLMGFLGGLVMSAMKRSMGVKDWGNMISGHGGILDRMDSLCFSAPIFFHVVRYFWA
ncbi:MAG: phosphatidate cytidylyltransferase, partial [Haemophilus parainfluenzae]|nr:phosphatidate cytidylyltransferase [Haemophilus parainfluenzae]